MNELDKKIQKTNNKAVSKYVFIICMLVIPLAQFAIFYVYMNFSNIAMAFKTWVDEDTYTWLPLSDFFLNFKEVLNSTTDTTDILKIALKNNVVMFFATWLIGMPLNLFYGYYLFKKKFGNQVIRILFMFPSMISGVVISMMFMKFVDEGIPTFWVNVTGEQLGSLLNNTSAAFPIQIIYALWLGFSTSIIIYSNAMNAMDPEIFEAGRIDGTTNWQEFLFMVIPMMMPTLTTYIVTGVAGMLTGAGSIFIFYPATAGGVPKETMLLGYYLFNIAQSGSQKQFPQAAAITLLITVVTLPATLFVRWLFDKLDPMKDNYKGVA